MRRYFLLVIILIPIAVYGFILYRNGTLSAIAPSAKPYLPAIAEQLTKLYERDNLLCMYEFNLVLNRTLNDTIAIRGGVFEPGNTRTRATHTYKKTPSPACNECERFEKMGLIRRQPQEGGEPGDYVFVLTPSGKEAYEPANRGLQRFCLGKLRFNQILEASPPASPPEKGFGSKYMNVIYTVNVVDPNPVLYSPDVNEQNRFPERSGRFPVFPQGKTTSIPILATFMTPDPDKVRFMGIGHEWILYGKWVSRQNELEKQIKAELQSRAAKQKSNE